MKDQKWQVRAQGHAAQSVTDAGFQLRHSDVRAHVTFPRELQTSGEVFLRSRKVRLQMSVTNSLYRVATHFLFVFSSHYFTTLRTHFIYNFGITLFHCGGAL